MNDITNAATVRDYTELQHAIRAYESALEDSYKEESPRNMLMIRGLLILLNRAAFATVENL